MYTKIIKLSAWLATIIVMTLLLMIRVEMYLDEQHKMEINHLESTCKTGDLVLFRWYYMDAGFRIFSKFSHVGLVVRAAHTVYILEMHPEGEYLDFPSGIHLHLLRDRVASYGGPCYFLRLNDGCSGSLKIQRVLNEHLESFKESIEFDTNFRNNFVLNWFSCTLGLTPTGPGGPSPPRKLFCSQFIGYILHLAGLVTDYTELSPGSFTSLKCNDGNGIPLYGKLHKIV